MAVSSLTSVLPRILGFLSKGEDYVSASQVSRCWRAASHAAKPQTLVIDTCFGSDEDSSSSSDEEADDRRRLHMLWYWFKLKMDSGRMTELSKRHVGSGRRYGGSMVLDHERSRNLPICRAQLVLSANTIIFYRKRSHISK